MIKRWARHFDNCIVCHQTDTKHTGKGVCLRCYSAQYAKANSDRVKAQKRDWYFRHGGKVAAKVQREQRHYSGLRGAVLSRDGFKCVVCGSVVALVVHHKDGQGRGSKQPNNTMDNLETRCRPCHVAIHRQELIQGMKSRPRPWGGINNPVPCCQACGTVERKHNGHGLCSTCYAKYRRATPFSKSRLMRPKA